MRRSTERILTTHVGSLPEPADLDPDAPDYETKLKGYVAEVVAQQRETGLDIINEGEYTKGGDWLSFIESRFSGFEAKERPADEPPMILRGKDREEFADFYRYAAERGSLFFTGSQTGPTRPQIRASRPYWVCTGPIAYSGQEELSREIALLKDAAGTEDVFLTSTAAGSLEVYRRNDYYATDEEYLYALTEALAVEYRMITDAGILLQVDDAWLPALWDRIGMQMGLEAFRNHCELRVEALNHALEGIPEEMVRYHLCWGSWHGPHAYDLELRHIVDILLKVKAGAYLIEGANARHEHEWVVWQDTKLPEGKILVPGVVTHSTDTIEHPEIVSQRLQNYARLVGKENVIAGADCGFGGRSHPQVAWAKLRSLVEGAQLASKALY
jgi:5-methyltetrahydropteroyltriglutamate--homocysteine methyltransferase